MVAMSLLGFCFLASSGTPAAHADFIYGEPTNLGSAINSSGNEVAPYPSPDGRELYYLDASRGLAMVARRATPDSEWGPATPSDPPFRSPGNDVADCITPDGLRLFMSSDRTGGSGGLDLWVTTRATVDSGWDIPASLGPNVNSASADFCASISTDGLELYFTSDRPGGVGGEDIYVAKRTAVGDAWGAPVNLGPTLNSAAHDSSPSISPDGLLLFFDSRRSGGYGSGNGLCDIYVASRATPKDPWSAPTNCGPVVSTSYVEWMPHISANGLMLYFHSNRPGGLGGFDIWQVPILPIVDFNGDGKVAIQDLLRLIESWGTADPLVDTGPMPWGDGKVDEKDLEVLMGSWGREANDPTLIAHWKLDEVEGVVAADSAGTNDASLVGNPIWQPANGAVDGAILLDGVDDCVAAPFLCDPAARPFSVFAWVKGGGPGQVILSQDKGANWLMVAATTGGLRTELMNNRTGKALDSAIVVTDDAWHRVGISWDGSNRILYIDDVEVAKDTQDKLTGSTGGLYIGAGSKLAAGTYWSGLIDDVRVYNRAVEP